MTQQKNTFDPVISENTTLARTAKQSGIFVLIGKCIRYTFVFIVQMLLMNILVPADFGLLRFVTVVIGIINLLNEFGLSFAIVQKKSLGDNELASAFSLNALLGLLLYVVTFFAAPYCASYFGNAEITNLIRVGGLASLFGAFSIVHRSLLQRRLEYGRLALIEIIAAFAGSSTALAMALSGCGVWSLLGSMLVYNILSSIILLFTVPWPHGNYTQLKPAKALGLFGAGVVIQRIAEYAASNFDFIVVGKAFGDKILGVYSIAFTIITLPQIALGVVIGNVLMSMVSRIQNDDKQLGDVFLKLNLFTSIISVPFFVIVFSFAGEMMHTVSFINHGDKWLPAAGLLKILSLLGLLFAFSSYPGTIWLAKGKVRLRIFWAVMMAVSVVIAVLAGLPHGITGICFALVIRGVIFFPIILWVTYRVIGLKPLRYIKTLLPSIICGSIMLAGIAPLSRYVPGTSFLRDMWVFLGGSSAGLLLYVLVFKLLFKKSFAAVWDIIKMRGIKLW